ncbi:MAG: 5-formyltetrahydrofolate cyclo-ligase [Verrucomicrobia bacterium]|jgi:5-formyltetrahydrofolate cyclo-ligase|nr:5-formyltetrahydrofolate cyclo-ligase [Verrucomicrobiota bacterium]
MIPNVAEQKASLRKQYRVLCRSVAPEQNAAASEDLRKHLLGSLYWQDSQRILMFYPLNDEPDIAPLFTQALAAGKTIALPRYNSSLGVYEAALIRNLTEDLVPGRFGVREPSPNCPAVPLNQLDLTLVPGIAFDASGRRLGRGKGFYDRLLPGTTGMKLGLAFDWQESDALPAEPHDVELDAVLTPTRWLKVI